MFLAVINYLDGRLVERMVTVSEHCARLYVCASFLSVAWLNSTWLFTRIGILGSLFLILGLPLQRSQAEAIPAIREVNSRSFRLRTDLDEATARQRLDRMERLISFVAAYWGRPLPDRIDCFLVDRVDDWPAETLPSEMARRVLQHYGGGTDLRHLASGTRPSVRATIYATTTTGVVEHEVVHAYCFQAFGRGGPDWYREGMAELFAQHALTQGQPTDKDRWAGDLEGPIALLKSRAPESLRVQHITAQHHFTEILHRTMDRGASDGFADATTAWHWTAADARQLDDARLVYAQSWALCHLLHFNPNYRQPFRRLGGAWLQGKETQFEEIFGKCQTQIDFELARLVHHFEHGYRADLCAWDWRHGSRRLKVGETERLRVQAARGYQATAMIVEPGQVYEVATRGTWQVVAAGPSLSGQGDARGHGCLEGAVLHSFVLGAPVAFDDAGEWQVRQSGQLYLRCRDDWHRLSDNRGTIEVIVLRTR